MVHNVELLGPGFGYDPVRHLLEFRVEANKEVLE